MAASRTDTAERTLRIAAGVLGVVGVGCGVAGTLFVFLNAVFSTGVPNAYAEYSEMFPARATWGEVWLDVAGVTVVAFVVGLIWLVAIGCLRFAFGRSTLRPVTGVAIPVGFALSWTALLGLGMVLGIDDARLAPNCGTFRFDARAWQSDEPAAWENQAIGLQDCGTFTGLTRAQLTAELGTPPRARSASTMWKYRDGLVSVLFSPARGPDRGLDRVRQITVATSRMPF